MLSYQHAYHAGNAADLHKHAGLAAILTLLTQKPRALSYLESHAGRGLYDLDGPEARKTGEAAQGIDRAEPTGAYASALARLRARAGPRAYPGSPLLAAELLRPQDRMILCELHPQEHAALAAAIGARAEIHRRDGHEGLRALTPPKPRRGLALIDPSYEVKDEYVTTAETARAILARWPEGVVLVWYPVLPAGRHTDLLDRLQPVAGTLVSEIALQAPPERGMQGAGLVVLNPPYGAGSAIQAACAPFSRIFRLL